MEKNHNPSSAGVLNAIITQLGFVDVWREKQIRKTICWIKVAAGRISVALFILHNNSM